MRKIIIFIIYIYSGDCKGQSSVSTFIQTLLDTVYANYYDHPIEDEVRIYFADSALKHNFFIKDSVLLVLVIFLLVSLSWIFITGSRVILEYLT